MSYRIEVSPPDHPHLVDKGFDCEEIEDAAQVFQAQAEPGDDWPLVQIVEDLATKDSIDYLKPDGRTVVARLVVVGVGV